MRSYADALAIAESDDPRVPFTMPGRGGVQYVRFVFDVYPDVVLARVAQTDVVKFFPDHVGVRTGGWVTRTTGEGIDAALGIPGAFTTWHRVPYVLGHRMAEPTVLTYSGERIGDLWDDRYPWTPLAPARRADLAVVDVSPQGPPATSPVRVTLRDWTYDGRDHTATMRHIAAAHVGRRGARTRVVRRDHSPTHEEPLVTILVETEA